MRPLPRAVTAAAAVGLLTLPLAAQSGTRLVFVQASTAAGPLLTLTPADFTIRENGDRRGVVSAQLSSAPMRIALVVDTSEAAAPALAPLRDGLQAFVRTLAADHEVALATTGRQPRVLVPPTTDRERLAGAIRTIVTDRESGNALLDTLRETDARVLQGDDVSWPVFVVVTTDGSEASTATRTAEFNAFVQGLAARAATVHAVMLQRQGRGGMSGQVATGLADLTGGHASSLDLTVPGAILETLRALAETITAHHRRMSTYYRVAYRSESATPQPIEIGVTTDGRADIDILFARRVR